MKAKKIFFGIPILPKVARKIATHMEMWGDLPLRLTRERNLHITLLFLGFRGDDDIAEALDAAREVAFHIEPFDILLDKTLLAPEGGKHPETMVWFSGEPSEDLRRLRNVLEDALGILDAEKKQFRPHVTLARIRREKWDALSEKPILAPLQSVSIPASSIALFASTFEKGKGLTYEIIEEMPLG